MTNVLVVIGLFEKGLPVSEPILGLQGDVYVSLVWLRVAANRRRVPSIMGSVAFKYVLEGVDEAVAGQEVFLLCERVVEG